MLNIFAGQMLVCGMKQPQVLLWFAKKLCRLWTALFREESELVADNYSALIEVIGI